MNLEFDMCTHCKVQNVDFDKWWRSAFFECDCMALRSVIYFDVQTSGVSRLQVMSRMPTKNSKN